MEGKFWYVLQVKFGSEKRVGKNLEKAGFEVCVPTQQEIHQWSDRKKRVEVGIFCGYVFICIASHEKNKVFIEKNIFCYVKLCGKVCILQAEEMDLIKKLGLVGEGVKISSEKIGKGSVVEILGGVLLGFRGIVKDAENEDKIRIIIANLNCFAEVVLENVPIKLII